MSDTNLSLNAALATRGATPPAAPEQPHSIFDTRQKALIIFLITTATTCESISAPLFRKSIANSAPVSGFASNIYFPALPTIADDLDVSAKLVNLSVTSYLIFQGIAPSLWGPLSDVKGRRLAYCCTFIVFFGACIGLAELRNYPSLIILRCLQSTGSASTIAIGSGVLGDITTQAERGGYMGIFQAGLLVPVAIGPVIGGVLAGSFGWRSIFWLLAIYSGVFLICLVFLLPETLRSMVGNGSRFPSIAVGRFPLIVYQRMSKVKWEDGTEPAPLAAKKRIDIIGPFRILISKHAAPVIIFLAIYYAVWQMSITAMSSLFKSRYGLSETQIGLTFIANGVGSMVGTLVTGRLLDLDYRRVKTNFKQRGSQKSPTTNDSGDALSYTQDTDFPLEQARLRLCPLFAIAQCLSILLFGWTVQYPHHINIAGPIISTFITGWTAVSIQSMIMTCLVDGFPDRSAAASASLNLARCLFAAAGTSFVMPMVEAIGVGMSFTACAMVQFVAIFGLVLQLRFAGGWRRKYEEAQKEEDSELKRKTMNGA